MSPINSTASTLCNPKHRAPDLDCDLDAIQGGVRLQQLNLLGGPHICDGARGSSEEGKSCALSDTGKKGWIAARTSPARRLRGVQNRFVAEAHTPLLGLVPLAADDSTRVRRVRPRIRCDVINAQKTHPSAEVSFFTALFATGVPSPAFGCAWSGAADGAATRARVKEIVQLAHQTRRQQPRNRRSLRIWNTWWLQAV